MLPDSLTAEGIPRAKNLPPAAMSAGPASLAYAARASWLLISR